MILKEIEPELDQIEYGELYPRYNGQSLANVPYTIMDTLKINHKRVGVKKEFYQDKISFDGINKVALILLDGFGYKLWLDSNSRQGFFKTLSEKGLMMPITTIFPSTTAAAITTINTGLTPLEHGLPEWILYLKEIKMIINTLPFTPYMSEKRVNLLDMGVDPKILYNGKTIYEALNSNNVESTTITHRMLTDSAYTKVVKRGSNRTSLINPTDGVIKLRKLIESSKGKSYFHLYMDNIDASTHAYGPFSEESRAEIDSISTTIQKQLLEKVDRKAARDTLVMVTADHGHTSVDPAKVLYMNHDKKLFSYLATDRGKKILPTGSPRAMFLHINKSDMVKAKAHLESELSDKARIMTSDEAIKMGLFGTGKPNKNFKNRIGNMLVLPKDNQAIWYEHVEGKKHKTIGVHGGLSKNEMLIPLGMARLSDLL